MKQDDEYFAGVGPAPEVLRGVPIHLPERWLADLAAYMEKVGWNRADLARAAGTSPPSITRLFANDTSTAIVSRVAAATRLPDPAAQLLDEELQRWMYAGQRCREMDPRKFRMILDTLMTTVTADDALADLFKKLPPRK